MISYTTTTVAFIAALLLVAVVASAQVHGVRARTDRLLQTMGVIDKFVLYNANTDQPILTLSDGMVINTVDLNVASFNIEATTMNGPAGSVKFGYNSNPNFRTESEAPYAFCGGTALNYFPCTVLIAGQHSITATSYSGTKGTGAVTSSKQISFSIVNGAPVKAPTNAPVKAPTKAPVKAPTNAPVKAPTNAPVKAPTKAPVKAPTKAPVKAPTAQLPCTFPKFTSGWQRFAPDYPIKVSETHAEMIGNDIVMTNGFLNGERNITNATYARDVSVANSAWVRMDDMPRRVGLTHSGTALVGTKMYLCGGYVGPHPGPHTSDCFVYDHSKPKGQQWAVFPSLPNGGAASGGLFYDSNTNALYFIGGAQRPILNNIFTVDTDRTYKYDFDTPAMGWVDSTPIPYTSNHASYATIPFEGVDRHYYFGGHKGDSQINTNTKDVFEFVAATETWIRRTSLPYGRGHSSTATRRMGNCGMVVFGGMIDGGLIDGIPRFNGTSDIHYYHIPFNNWTKIGNMVGVRTSAFVLTNEHSVYFITEINSHTRTYMP